MVTGQSMSAHNADSASDTQEEVELPAVTDSAFVPLGPDALPPRTDLSPFPTLHPDALQDPLEAQPEAPAPSAPPPLPLPRSNSSHLRLVPSEPDDTAASGDLPTEVPTDRAEDTIESETPAPSDPTPASEARAFGTNPPRGASIVPSPQAPMPEWTPALRRQESVIEEAAALRSGPSRYLKDALRFVRAHAPSGLTDRLLQLSARCGGAALRVLRRFERLPRRQQLFWVGAPYVAAMVLVVLLLSMRGGEQTATPVVPLTPATPSQAGLTAAPALAAVVPAPAPAPAVARDEAPVAAPTPKPPEAVTLLRRSKLFIRADAKSRRPISLRAGTELSVFEDFPAPEGWRLVQTKKGSVGFVSARHLNDQPDPEVDALTKRKKRRARRRRRRR